MFFTIWHFFKAQMKFKKKSTLTVLLVISLIFGYRILCDINSPVKHKPLFPQLVYDFLDICYNK